ncbi:peptidase S41 [Tenacibaculum sp. AHE15PA]|uniref:S41 family peptidase n=1 Tax=unclassified Tenacibaculum TaxID=2635139 RepID=UPI001C4E8784|nr:MULTISPECIES: S41 family peptidase [unclassified Tenacibaculum]QXP73916.1 peptidase S41 [Tenacibaculum sp. AHE14PA]QXP75717.1 peptidase S41 [Tenacibaculum sp. AHE15PA]
MKILKASLIVFLLLSIVSCSEKDDTPTDVQIQNFVWKGLNAYYLWQSDVPDLSDRRFNNDQELYSYLSEAGSPENLFNNLLFLPNEYPKDPNRTYSWIVDDYIALEESFEGTRQTTGMKVRGADFADGSNNYYVYVYDVVKNSDAETKGVVRGMLITEVNGTSLTRANVNSLFSTDSFTVGLADYNAGNPVSNGTTITLTRATITENPIKEAKVIVDGGNTIGYLMYNQFSSDFDGELNAEFAKFKSPLITDLVIDLRYNGGGSVQTAVYLGSMVTGQFKDQLYAKEVWNSKVLAAINPEFLINNFTDKILNKDSNGNVVLNETINSLNLNTIYFIVSENTASASELIINALSPYIDVKLIGAQTYGKHVGSITLYDSDDFRRNGPNFKTNHTYAMQPIVLEIQNVDGENKPDGFTPEVLMEEDPGNLGVIGDPTEPLLERAIQYITTGAKGVSLPKKINTNYRPQWNSNMKYSDYNNMYIDLK